MLFGKVLDVLKGFTWLYHKIVRQARKANLAGKAIFIPKTAAQLRTL